MQQPLWRGWTRTESLGGPDSSGLKAYDCLLDLANRHIMDVGCNDNIDFYSEYGFSLNVRGDANKKSYADMVGRCSSRTT